MAGIIKSIEKVTLVISGTNVNSHIVSHYLTKGQDVSQCVPFYTNVRGGTLIQNGHNERIGRVFFDASSDAVNWELPYRYATGPWYNEVQIVEFDPSITVQTKTFTMGIGVTNATVTVPVNSIGNYDTFGLISYNCDPSSLPAANREAPNQVALNHGDCSAGGPGVGAMQMSRYDASSWVLHGTVYFVTAPNSEFYIQKPFFQLTGSVESAGFITGLNSCDPQRTLVIGGYQTSRTVDDIRDCYAAICVAGAGSQQTFAHRAYSLNALDTVLYYPAIVTCNNSEWFVEHHNLDVSSSASEVWTLSSTFVESESVVISTIGGVNAIGAQVMNDSRNGGLMDDNAVAFTMLDGNRVQSDRANAAAGTGYLEFSVIGFTIVSSAAGPTVYSRTLSDSATMQDQQDRYADSLRNLLNSISMTDLLAQEGLFQRMLADAFSSTDNLTQAIERVRVLQENAELFDIVSRIGLFERALIDPVDVNDTMLAQIVGTFVRKLQEKLDLSDSARQYRVLMKALIDSAEINDNLKFYLSYSRHLSDNVTVSDTISAYIIQVIARFMRDNADLYDGIVVSADLSRILSEATDLSDLLQYSRGEIIRILNDNPQYSDVVLINQQLWRVFADNVELNDAVDVLAFEIAVRLLSDSIDIIDDLSTIVAMSRGLRDAIQIAALMARDKELVRTLIDYTPLHDDLLQELLLLIVRQLTSRMDVTDEMRANIIKALVDILPVLMRVVMPVIEAEAQREPVVQLWNDNDEIQTAADIQPITQAFNDAEDIDIVLNWELL